MSPLDAVLKIVKDSKGTGNFKSYTVSLAQTSKNWRNSRVRFNRTDWQTWKGLDQMALLDTNIIKYHLIGKQKIVEMVNDLNDDQLSSTFVNEYGLLKYKNIERLGDGVKNL